MTTMTNYQTPTAETSASLDAAFNHFNAELFDHRQAGQRHTAPRTARFDHLSVDQRPL
jgi:hypothetical protein